MPSVADDDGGGRYLTAAQTARLADAMETRKKQLGAVGYNLWPLSRNTPNLWGRGKTRAQIGTLADVDLVMWWEPDSALHYARGEGPIRPHPKPTPLQWAIFDARCRRELRYADTAAAGGVDEDGKPLITAAQVEDLERQPLYQPPDETTLAALALALDLDVDKLRRYAAASLQPVGDAAVNHATKALLDRVGRLPGAEQHGALTSAALVVESAETRHLVELLNRLPEHAHQAAVGTVRELLADDGLRHLVGRLIAVPDSDRAELFDSFATIVRVVSRAPGRVGPEIDHVAEAAAIAKTDDQVFVEHFRDSEAIKLEGLPEETDDRG